MKPSSEQVAAFTSRIGSICQEFDSPVNIRKIDFRNVSIYEGGQATLSSGTAYIQDIPTRDNRILQFMLDAGGNVWENYTCFGPIPIPGKR